jgi:hypothetical protein
VKVATPGSPAVKVVLAPLAVVVGDTDPVFTVQFTLVFTAPVTVVERVLV